MQSNNIGRGTVATSDMKARITALRRQGADVVEALWERNRRAVLDGEGFEYEYAQKRAEQV